MKFCIFITFLILQIAYGGYRKWTDFSIIISLIIILTIITTTIIIYYYCLTILFTIILASNFPKCKHGDEPCLIKGAADILKNHTRGVADVNLLPIDPFSLKTLNVARNPASPVNVDIKLKDVIVEGFKDIKLEKFQ